MSEPAHANDSTPPLAPGFLPNVKFDLQAGFLVFLVAMPLCLGIATASQYPPVVGIWTAVVGGVMACILSNSQLTIKGPAAGLIMILAGAVGELGAEALPGASLGEQLAAGHKLALGIGITAGVIQILLGLFKAGKLGEIIPLTPVHGMLAAIGVTIMAKQLFPMLGIPTPTLAQMKETLELPEFLWDGIMPTILSIPGSLSKVNPTIATVGLTGLAILIVFPYLKARIGFLKPVPAQLVVLLVAVPLGLALGLGDFSKALVSVPNVLDNPSEAFFVPDFRGVATATGIKYVVLFALIGSIESLLSSQAIDLIDPWRRKTDQNRDLLAVGVANTICSAIGALPMISEIVRSKANIDNGARTKYANLFHALFLLAFVLLLPSVIRSIPMAALGAMLVFTGFRLASPKEFIHTLKIGPEQLFVFVATIVTTLCTDLLIGVGTGIALKFVIHVLNGAPLSGFFKSDIVVVNTDNDKVVVLKVRRAALFSNWLSVKGAILTQAVDRDEVVLDLSETKLVDHSTMEKLHQLEQELSVAHKVLKVVGLDGHKALSEHPLAARKSSVAVAPVAG